MTLGFSYLQNQFLPLLHITYILPNEVQIIYKSHIYYFQFSHGKHTYFRQRAMRTKEKWTIADQYRYFEETKSILIFLQLKNNCIRQMHTEFKFEFMSHFGRSNEVHAIARELKN